MTNWNDVRRHIRAIESKKMKVPKYALQHSMGSNVLDNFANFIKGSNDCTSIYIQNNGRLKISANCKINEEETIVTNYEEECMVQYAEAFKFQAASRRQALLNIFKSDKRLVELKFEKFDRVSKKIQIIIKQLEQNIDQGNYQENDDFMSSLEDKPIAVTPPPLPNVAERLGAEQSDFSQYLKNLQNNITPRQILDRANRFVDGVNELIREIDQGNELINNAIEVITAKLPLIQEEDLRFVRVLNDLLNNTDDELSTKLFNALKQDLEYVFEINNGNLYENIIRLFPDYKQYHSEHRLAVDIERNAVRNDEYDYIGISRTCCAICYYIVYMYYRHNVEGTHGSYCNGDALIGLSLHPDNVQKEILRGLFPELDIETSSESESSDLTEDNPNDNPFINHHNPLAGILKISGIPDINFSSDDDMDIG